MKENILSIIGIALLAIIMIVVVLSELFMVTGLILNIVRIGCAVGLIITWMIIRKIQ